MVPLKTYSVTISQPSPALEKSHSSVTSGQFEDSGPELVSQAISADEISTVPLGVRVASFVVLGSDVEIHSIGTRSEILPSENSSSYV